MDADADGPPNRFSLILGALDRSMRIVEIGPSYNPIIPKTQGWNTTVVDYAPQAELRAIYAQHGAPVDRIEPVDVVWPGGLLADAFPPAALGTFDAVVASHVIEHSPDIVRFLQSCRLLLREGGRVLLAVPDRRECFDFFKASSTSADALEAFEQRRSRHTKRTLFLHIAFAARTQDGIAWGRVPPNRLSLVHDLHQARDAFNAVSEDQDAPYVDVHAWFFTPASFELLVTDLNALGLIDLAVDFISPPLGSEFVAVLRPGTWVPVPPAELAARRLALLKREVAEIREQGEALHLADSQTDP